MTVDLERLIAFADGELPDDERAEVEAALAANPELRAQLDAQIRLRAQLSAAFDPVLKEAPPARLTAMMENRTSNVVSLADRRRRSAWTFREWGAMAASLVGGLVVGVGAMNAQSPPFAATQDGLAARGSLARALDTQLAADTGGTVRIGLSFRDHDGAYCRTFALAAAETAGLACHHGGDWRVTMTAQAQNSNGEIRTAGSDTPPAILSAVEGAIEGDPLDAVAESHARAAGWRSPH